MTFKLALTDQALDNWHTLKRDPSLLTAFKSVRKALAYLEANPKHPSLNTHKYNSLSGSNNEEVFEACAQNKTPGAYRIFWHYGPTKHEITILAITKHP